MSSRSFVVWTNFFWMGFLRLLSVFYNFCNMEIMDCLLDSFLVFFLCIFSPGISKVIFFLY